MAAGGGSPGRRVLEAETVSCSRGDRPLFAPVSFSLKAGALLQVRGPNGQGKSTLMRALAGLSWAAQGEVRWSGERIRTLGEDYRREIVYVGHLNGLHGELTPLENLRFFASLEGLGRRAGTALAENALERLRLSAHAELPAKFLSQGQKRRLALGRLLLTGRRLWLLDEPFAALDVHSTGELAQWIGAHLAGGGLTVLISHQEIPIPVGTLHSLPLIPFQGGLE